MLHATRVIEEVSAQIQSALEACVLPPYQVKELNQLWRHGLTSNNTEQVLDVVDDGTYIEVVQYDIFKALAGAASLLSGSLATFGGALAIGAGIVILKKSKKRFEPGAAIILATLATAFNHEMQLARLKAIFHERSAEIFASRADNFAASLAILKDHDIVGVEGSVVYLRETCKVNALVW